MAQDASEAPLNTSLHAESLHGPLVGHQAPLPVPPPSPGGDVGPYKAFLFSSYHWPVQQGSDKTRAAPASSWSRACVSIISYDPKLGEEAHFTD